MGNSRGRSGCCVKEGISVGNCGATLGEQSEALGRMIAPSKLPPLVFEYDFPVGEPIPHILIGGRYSLAKRLSIVNNFQAFSAQLINH
jgi:hypothetical protein